MTAIGTGMMGATGFGWSIAGFVLGLVWAVVIGFYIAAVFVPVYNFLQHRETAPRPTGATGQPVSAHV
jgi:hypothetical protein